MTDNLDDYPKGPGYRRNCEASRDGARAAAPAKATQDAAILGLADKVAGTGLSWWEASQTIGDAIRPDIVRARISCLKKAGKLVKLPIRRMGGYGVRVSVYVLPRYAPNVDCPQGDLLS